MFAQKKTSPNIQCIDALVPRSLIACGKGLLQAQITEEGLCPLRMHIKDGCLNEIEVIQHSKESSLSLLLPRLIEPHAHIDKAFTWKSFPNFSGTYQNALQANLEEQKGRTMQKVRDRAERSMKLSLKNGIRAVRSHVDSFDSSGQQTWEVLKNIKSEWEEFVELQLVALVPLEYWTTKRGKDLARQVSAEGGLLGGVIVPPYHKANLRELLINFFCLANDMGCGIDIHVDETSLTPGGGIREIIYVLEQIDLDIPITCSHLSSMGLLPSNPLKLLAERIASFNINVVALPFTNFWLLARSDKTSPIRRPIAPIKQLQNAGVNVAIGGDNVQDPWYPGGNFDPLSLMAASMAFAQIAPWNRLGLSTFTTGAARIMQLEWDGIIDIGCPADFVLLDADSWAGAMSTPPIRKVMINGHWIETDDLSLKEGFLSHA
ncbi:MULTISPECIES: amidohydrolase family protein [Prochlorococcus]|uniref:Cytosine deaminase n=1 Tax=Prochlorococcus marinus (strain SARG / CCMP1375 / SS120) TaxID=167539 RepID=Q7VAS6_PROMA|nr:MULTISPECIES: amidohydrolase family protein [Prochlorococcus]AAQ00422.1 Cytosine deaminase [Prochlorococcus marinus subsp. marinus str. CCMP1375]KGG14305.1 Cytosine deaminase [Prochlorococcus marinus str. LG]KGG22123.1 Cytosine deaminase [Prochlorococcus marinus str. SS2]KGG24560.1 Cytosine deaminase [Prochlorococcus marinus str. SS35]KGG33454.1 Cytosine deaminase [Prochlorococcus marinus str. SS51]